MMSPLFVKFLQCVIYLTAGGLLREESLWLKIAGVGLTVLAWNFPDLVGWWFRSGP